MTSLGFENYAEALKIYLTRYREVSCPTLHAFFFFLPIIAQLHTPHPFSSPTIYRSLLRLFSCKQTKQKDYI